MNNIDNYPKSHYRFEILSDRDLNLLDSNMFSDEDGLSYASVLSKGSNKKNLKFLNNKNLGLKE